MGFPLAALAGLYGLTSLIGASANLYSQSKQRELFYYQRKVYERQLADLRNWEARTGRKVRYPEFGPAGKIRAIDTGISQSYLGSIGTVAGLGSSLGSSYYYASNSSGLYSSNFGKGHRTSRYL